MPASFPPFSALALHKGNSQNLQLVGLGDDGALYLAAWQSHATGTWTVPDTNPLAFQTGTFSAVALGNGNSDRLQVLGLGADGQIYLAAWQHEDGAWIEPIPANAGPMGDPERRYTAVAAERGAGYLNVFGLGADGRIYVVATQDGDGRWQADDRILSAPGISYASIVTVTDAQGWLQLLGLATDGRAYWVASLTDGWSRRGEPIGDPKHRYTALAAARGNGRNLQVLGLGTDRKIYLAAWQDEKQAWHISQKYGGPLGNESRPYATVAAHAGADRNLQVVCLGTDGKAYLATYQDKDGGWHAPSSKSNGPLGDPAVTYRALALASGDRADKSHPGDLEVVGLGAGENDDGLAYVATSQDRDGRWHKGQPLGKVRSPIVNWEAPTGQRADAGCVAFGRFWVAQGSSVVSFDIISGAPGRKLSQFGSNASPRFIQPYGDRLAVACDDGRVYAADPGTGAISVLATVGVPSWMAAYEGALYVAGNGVVRIGPDGAVSHPYGVDILGGAPTVASGAVYVPISSSGLGSGVDVLDAATMSRLWSAGADGRPGPVFCDGTRLCFTTGHRSLFVYDVASRKPITPHGKPIGLAAETDILPVFNNGLCYVALGGAVQAIEVKTGKSRRSFAPVRDPVGTPVMNASGVLFYGSTAAISMVNPVGSSDDVVTYATGGTPVLAAYQDGALFYADSASAAAIRLDEVIHQFYVETCLIQDFDFSNGVGAAALTPNFQVEVALFDTDGSPRIMQPVRLTATAPTTLAYQGRRMRISPTEAVDVETDGSGRLRIAVAAGTMNSDGTSRLGLTAPELVLTSPFMDRRMRVVVRPSGQLQQQLATIEKAQLKAAKGYDGALILTDEYRRSDKRLTAATGAINQTSGMVHASMSDARKRDAGNMYCDPACDMAVACCMPASDPGCRVICDQSFSFDLTQERAHFRLLSVAEAEAATSGLLGEARALGDWGSLWEDIKSGAAKVTGAVVTAVAAGAHAVITTLKGTFSGLVSTIEHAALLVQGIFNEIASAIHRVVEAVSFLFDWPKILALHDQIRDQITAAWDALDAGTGVISYDSMKSDVSSMLSDAKTHLDEAFEAAKGALDVKTPLEAQAAETGQANTAVDSAQNNWLLAKFSDDVTQSDGLRDSSVWPNFNFGPTTKGIFAEFETKLSEKLRGELEATIQRVREDLDFQSSPGFLARGFAAVIDILRGLVDLTIEAGQAIWDLLIDLLRAVICTMKEVLSDDMPIPFISQLYEWATDKKPSWIDGFALLTAIPTGFALKLFDRQPAYASGVSSLSRGDARLRQRLRLPVAGWLTVAAGCAQGIWGVLVAVCGLIRSRVVSFVLIGLACIVVRGLFLAALFYKSRAVNFYSTCLFIFPTAIMIQDMYLLWKAPAGTDYSVISAAGVPGAIIGGILMVVCEVVLFWQSKKVLGDFLLLLFSISVALSFGCRLAMFLPVPYNKLGVALPAGCTLLSGGFEVVRGLGLKGLGTGGAMLPSGDSLPA